MEEKILISIELEKGDNEKQVDALTQKITGLTKANADLNKQNKELLKSGQENSKEYLENSKQIEINKQKITESAAARKGLIASIIAEDDSIKALRIRNAELIKQRDQLSTKTSDGQAAIAKLNKELDANNKVINDNSSALERQKFNIGNYKSALDGIIPGLGGFVDGIEKGTKAGLAFIATPIGLVLAAVGAALFALTSYFKGSEEGQNRLNKIMAVGSAIMEQFMNVVEDVGKFLFEAFSNPKQAVIDLANLIKTNIVNRFEGLLELIPQLGKAIEQLFKGNFADAGKIAADAVIKVGTGIENATDKIAGFIEETGRLVEEGIKNGEKIADLNAKIDKDERALIVERAKSALEVAKLRENAITQEGELKKKTINEAIALEQELTDKEVGFAKTKLALAEQLLKANGDDKEAKKAVAEATAAVFNAEVTAFSNTLKFRKQLQALDEEQAKAKQKEAEETKRQSEEIKKAEEEQFKNNIQIIEENGSIRLKAIQENYLNELISKDEFEAQFTNLEFTALEERKNFLIANGESTTAIEAQILDRQIKLKLDADQKELDAEKKLADSKTKIRASEQRGLEASLDAGVALAKAAFGENKAIAAAEVVLNTVRSIQRAYADFPTPYSLIVSALMAGLGAVNLGKILGVQFGNGGIAQTGGVLNGPSHKNGGIPFAVGGRVGFEAEGGEAIINKRATAMYRPLLSQINQAGGGVSFGRGGTLYQSGNIVSATQTRVASASAERNSQISETIRSIMSSMPPIVVTVEDINAKQNEVFTTEQRAQVL